MSYACKIAKTVDEIDLAAWRQVCDDDEDAPMDVRYLRAVERSNPAGSEFEYLTFLDEQGDPIAAACVSQFTLDGAMFFGQSLASVVRLIRKVFPRYLNFRVIMCGMPVSIGASNIRVHAMADPDRLMRSLDQQLRRIAKEKGAWLIVAKEFTDAECAWADQLEEIGYLKAESLPMNTFEHSFSSLDEFLQALRSHYRYKIKRSQKKFAQAGITVERYTDPEEISRLYTEELHQLYIEIVNKAEHRLEILPREFFIELGRQLAPQIVLTLLRQGDEVVAFAWSLHRGTVYRNMFVGVDGEANDRSDAYFNLMLIDMDHALREGATKIYFGQTADTFKSRLGCFADPRSIYVQAVPGWLHWSMVRCQNWIFPPFDSPEQRELFKPVEVPEAVRSS